MSRLTGNKKLVIPVLLLVAALVTASVAIVLPSLASAQIVANPINNNTLMKNNHTGINNTLVNPADGNATRFPNQITGSINVRHAMQNFINENMNVTLADAIGRAESRITNGTVVEGHLGVVHNYLVYTITVANIGNGTLYKVIVDAGNGSVLYTSLGMPGCNLDMGMRSMQENWTSSHHHYHHRHHHHYHHSDW
jgi:hypothetical protein